MSEAEPAGRPHVAPDLASLDRARVHPQVRAAAEWAWRLLLLLFAAYVAAKLFVEFEEVLVPVALAILIAAMLVPAVDALDRRGVPRSLAVLLNILLALGFIAGVMTFVVREFMRGVPQLVEEVSATVERTKEWLIEGPLDLDPGRCAVRVPTSWTSCSTARIGSPAARSPPPPRRARSSPAHCSLSSSSSSSSTEVIRSGGSRSAAYQSRPVTGCGERGSPDSGRSSATCGPRSPLAFVDACGISVGLANLQVPLALPLASLVFLGAFIPIVGALLSGSLAVLVALITQGWLAAVVALAIVVGVMQLESHVLQPFLLGRSVRPHPVAVVLGIAAGLVSAGIIGGLLAVPLIAFLNTAIRHLKDSEGAADDQEAAGGHVVEPSEPVWDTADPDATAEAVAERGTRPGGETPKSDESESDPRDPGPS